MSNLFLFFLFNSLPFRCSAQNEYLKTPKKVRHSLEVINSITANNAKLLLPLQQQALFIPNGGALTLHCAPTSTATSKGNTIRWTFTNRSSFATPTELQTSNPNQLHILNTSVDANDGIYKCYFGDQHQVRDSTVRFIVKQTWILANSGPIQVLFDLSNGEEIHRTLIIQLLFLIHLVHFHFEYALNERSNRANCLHH